MSLIAIKPPAFDCDIALSYAGVDNFMGRAVYRSDAAAYLHADAAICFGRAIEMARILSMRFVLYDAYRPQEAQELLWHHTPDPEFITDPKRGSPHSRGVAVDVTLKDMTSGKILDMGTAFDAFTPQSHHGSDGLSQEAMRNRFMLLGLMVSAGFDYFRNEWWHYQLPQASSYELLRDGAAAPPMMKVR